MTTKIQGSQFILPIESSVAGYGDCEQIIAVFYDSINNKIDASFVKVASEKYPLAELIVQNSENDKVLDLFFSSSVTLGMNGDYSMEIEKVIGGVRMPIYKSQSEVLKITTTMIPV